MATYQSVVTADDTLFAQAGHYADTISQLVSAGYLAAVPSPSAGYTIALAGNSAGEVTVNGAPGPGNCDRLCDEPLPRSLRRATWRHALRVVGRQKRRDSVEELLGHERLRQKARPSDAHRAEAVPPVVVHIAGDEQHRGARVGRSSPTLRPRLPRSGRA